MSYERRVEIEALPPEEGWGKWNAVIGYGTTLVERKNLAPLTIWVVGTSGPIQVEAYQYERWRFAEEISPSRTKPADSRGFFYTQWHSNSEYTDYSPRTTDLNSMCADSREELCRKVCEKLDGEIRDRLKSLAILQSKRACFV